MKSLTRQWQEGKLKEGYYYTLLDTDSKMIEINYCWDDGCFQDYCDNMIDKVLAPVPDYKLFKCLLDDSRELDRAYDREIKKLDDLKQKDEVINNLQKMVEDECSRRCKLEDKLREASHCLNLIEINTGAIGQSEEDMNESLIAIMNICRAYFGEN